MSSTTQKPLKKANLKSIKKLSMEALVETLKTIGKIVVVDILYSTKDILPDIGKNSGKQFVVFQGDNRDVKLGFNNFSKAVLLSGLEDEVYYKNADAEEAFNKAWSESIQNRYESEEKKLLKKQETQENGS
jgi:hypothetical protein